jgi:hypothetical protein
LAYQPYRRLLCASYSCMNTLLQTKILVSDLPEPVPAREIVGVYLRTWRIELLVEELKRVVGLGPHRSPNRPSASNAGWPSRLWPICSCSSFLPGIFREIGRGARFAYSAP